MNEATSAIMARQGKQECAANDVAESTDGRTPLAKINSSLRLAVCTKDLARSVPRNAMLAA